MEAFELILFKSRLLSPEQFYLVREHVYACGRVVKILLHPLLNLSSQFTLIDRQSRSLRESSATVIRIPFHNLQVLTDCDCALKGRFVCWFSLPPPFRFNKDGCALNKTLGAALKPMVGDSCRANGSYRDTDP